MVVLFDEEKFFMGAQKQRRSMAEKADKYKCYLKSVQSPEHEVEFFDKAFKDEFHRKPTTLREDFCGDDHPNFTVFFSLVVSFPRTHII